jgi:hypothetical protein
VGPVGTPPVAECADEEQAAACLGVELSRPGDLRAAPLSDDVPGVLSRGPPEDQVAALDEEIAALELARRAAASDVGTATVDRLEEVVDRLAIAYPGTSPTQLLPRVRRYLSYVTTLLDARATLAERRRLHGRRMAVPAGRHVPD